MLNFFKRLFRISKAESNALVDRIEDPVKMSEQAVRDLRKELEKSNKALAEVKSLVIVARSEEEKHKAIAAEYEKKAYLLLEKAQKGGMEVEEAEKLATQALTKKEDANNDRLRAGETIQEHEKMVERLEQNIKKLHHQINKWENEVKVLKARATVTSTTANVNKHLTGASPESAVASIEKMKKEIESEELLAESYSQIANNKDSVDSEIDKALEGDSPEKDDKVKDSLAEMKQKLGLK